VELTDSQCEQLQTFLQERDHTGEVDLRPAATLPEGYVEAVLLGEAGVPTPTKRILFP
jgi:hypothetical protein